MEDKIIILECIENGTCANISLGIEYKAIETGKGYKIISDYTYPKRYFKKVQGDTEEQLEHAQEKKLEVYTFCYNKECQHYRNDNKCAIDMAINCGSIVKEPINYEEEYNKLKKENEEITTNIKKLIEEDNIIRINNNKLKKENEGYKTTLEEKDEHIRNLNGIIDRKDDEIQKSDAIYSEVSKNRDKLLNENKELKEEYEKDKKANRQQFEEIAELKRLHENQRLNIKDEMSDNRELKTKVVELNDTLENELGRNRILNEKLEKYQKQNNQCCMEQMNKTIKDQKETLERLEKSTNEYYYNWMESQAEVKKSKEVLNDFQKEIDECSKKNKMNEAYLITYEKIIKNQKEAIKTLASLL